MNYVWIYIGAVVSLNLWPIMVQAGEHQLNGRLSAAAEHVNNVYLNTDRKEYMLSQTISPSVNYQYQHPTWQTELEGSWRLSDSSEPQINTDQHSLGIHVDKIGEHLNLKTAAKQSYSHIRWENIAETGQITNEPVIETDYNLSLSDQVTEWDQLKLTSDYSANDYTSELFTDYDTHNTAFTWQHALGANLNTQLQVFTQDYNAEKENIDNTNIPPIVYSQITSIKAYGVNVGLAGYWAETWQYQIMMGQSQSNNVKKNRIYLQEENPLNLQQNTQKYSPSDGIFSINLVHNSQFHTLTYEFSRQQQGTSNSAQVLADQFKLTYYQNISSQWTSHLALVVGKHQLNSNDQALANTLNRRFAEARFNLSYALNQRWQWTASINYYQQEFIAQTTQAESVTGAFTLAYQPLGWRW